MADNNSSRTPAQGCWDGNLVSPDGYGVAEYAQQFGRDPTDNFAATCIAYGSAKRMTDVLHDVIKRGYPPELARFSISGLEKCAAIAAAMHDFAVLAERRKRNGEDPRVGGSAQ